MARILIVEDSLTYRLQLRKLVEGLGHECVEASTTSQGVAMAIDEPPDLILMDIVMPAGEMDGYQAMRTILKEPTTAHVPVVLVTSKGQTYDKIHGERQGASGYITKPIDEKALSAVIEEQSKKVPALMAALSALRPKPVAPVAAPISQPAPLPAAAPAGPRAPARHTDGVVANILIVEDSETYRLQLQRLVESMGYTCLVADTTNRGVALATEAQPDLILMDIIMPAGCMNGYDALRALQKEPTTAHIPVVLVTSRTQPVDRARGEQEGASGYITKPINEAALAAVIDEQSRKVIALRASLERALGKASA